MYNACAMWTAGRVKFIAISWSSSTLLALGFRHFLRPWLMLK